VPAPFGGLDLDPLNAALIFEELGRGAVPNPLIASSVIATCLLRGCQPSEQRDAALTAIAYGGMILVPALRKPDTSWKGVAATGTPLTGSNGTWVLPDGFCECGGSPPTASGGSACRRGKPQPRRSRPLSEGPATPAITRDPARNPDPRRVPGPLSR
jgi:hypothetical protein